MNIDDSIRFDTEVIEENDLAVEVETEITTSTETSNSISDCEDIESFVQIEKILQVQQRGDKDSEIYFISASVLYTFSRRKTCVPHGCTPFETVLYPIRDLNR